MNVQEIISLIRSGQVAAIPTDTVYGLAVDYRNEGAVEALFELKGRDRSTPFVLLAASTKELLPLVQESLSPYAEQHWPGALTLVAKADPELVPSWVRSGLPTVGVRVPNHPETLALLKETGPLAVSSANPSGKPAATTLDQLHSYFGEEFPLLEGQPPGIGVASTVLRLSPFEILRQGSVSFTL